MCINLASTKFSDSVYWWNQRMQKLVIHAIKWPYIFSGLASVEKPKNTKIAKFSTRKIYAH